MMTPSPSLRILIADDNADAAQSLAMLLRMFGHDVKTALDGESALTLAITYQPQAMVLDIGLPRMNGYDLARKIRTTPEIASSLLIAYSGFGQSDDKQRARDAGFDHHLTKPAAIQDLTILLTPLQKPAP